MGGTVKNILIVDDIAENLQVLSAILSREGFMVRPVANGAMALEVIEAMLPDLILLDVRMPGMDGYEVCRLLKSQERTRHIPVIFLSAMTDTADKVHGFECGAVDYIAKPFNNAEALARVKTHLTLCEMQARLTHMNAELEQRVQERTRELNESNQHLQERIREREEAERALRKSEERFRAIYENSNDAVMLFDGEHFMDCNPRMLQMFGFKDKTEFIRLHPSKLSPPTQPGGQDSFSLAQEKLSVALREGNARFEWVHCRTNGEDFPAEILLSSFELDGRRVIQATLRDISEQKRIETERGRLEERLAQAQKMESIGRLAGGVAHDFNNILAIILGHGELAMADLSEDSPLMENLSEIIAAGERAQDLTRQLLAFSRKQVLNVKVLDINRVVRGMEKMIGRLLGEDIEVKFKLSEDLGFTRADVSQLEQVLMNLCVNARDAMPDGGMLIIETSSVYLDEDFLSRHPDTSPGAFICLSVSDTGVGIDEATQHQIFDPFFTTKEKGKGTGLGLATVYGIVMQHEGEISVYSEPGRGTTFRIYLPQSAETPVKPDISHVLGAAAGSGQTILVVEDEAPVRKIICKMLTHLGYKVIEAATADLAIRIASSDTELDLLLTDVIMPEMNGRQLQEQIHTIRPALKTLFMSGYTEEMMGRHGMLDAGIHFISKPFSETALSHKIRDIFDESRCEEAFPTQTG